jgi:hypothetical protein
VLEDPGEPGAQVRPAAEGGFAGQRGEQRLLHRVLGRVRVAQLQARVAQQVGALGFNAGAKIIVHGDGPRFYKGLETAGGDPTFLVPIQEKEMQHGKYHPLR